MWRARADLSKHGEKRGERMRLPRTDALEDACEASARTNSERKRVAGVSGVPRPWGAAPLSPLLGVQHPRGALASPFFVPSLFLRFGLT